MVLCRRGCKWTACSLIATALALTSQAGLAKEYLVKLKGQALVQSIYDDRSFAGAMVTDKHDAGSLIKVVYENLSSAQEARMLADLMGHSDVEYVVENFELEAFGQPNDPKFSEQWALAKVRAAEAWDHGVGSREVVVAVIDTGVDSSHPDLAANMWKNPDEIPDNGKDDDGNGLVDDVLGWDYLDNDADPADETGSQNPGHGTHCAGIVGAVGDNSTGISGMSQQVSILPLRFLGANGRGDLMSAIKAIDYAIDKKADVISASWGAQVSASQAQPLIEAIGRADQAGIVFVAAAANDGMNNDTIDVFPANADFPGVIAVAASNSSDGKPSWSNYGKAKVDVASPGAGILSTLPGSKYGELSGTSMATPLVAGLVALLKSTALDRGYGELSGLELTSILQATGAQVAIETACMCRIDAKAAAAALEANSLIVVPAAATFAPGATAQLSAVGGAGGYTFASANSSIVDVTAEGALTAKAEGNTTVTVTDSDGQTAQSLTFRVAEKPADGGNDCPFDDPALCKLMCQILPSLPWCR